ncbi:MAG: sodium-translocating pyrophosphatase [Candidatus Lokiarchaeota archaeon]|nr:sodium-translocating pyrophosphatase [Candidatus Lokiarchaeota archaeon]
MEKLLLLLPLISGVVAILLALYFAKLVMAEDPGNERMQEVSGYIESGAKTFIKVQYKVLAVFVIALAVALYFVPDLSLGHVISYLIGCAGSMWAGWFGMIIGVKSNARAAQGCTVSTKKGFDISFFGGAVMGLAVVGVALIGISAIYWILGEPTEGPLYVLGFSFGASSIALFMKCGGGIYTKTADVGADLVGKAEYNLPEDDPRNPASIADNVGDNVGDIAGMGSDLFDSYVASIVAAMLLSIFLTLNDSTNRIYFTILPILLSAFGLFASIIGIYAIKRWKTGDPSKLLNNGTYIATVSFILLALVCVGILSIFVTDPQDMTFLWALWACAAIGLFSGIVIGFTSDYYTREDKKPTREMAHAAQEGDAVVILSGFSYGLVSVVPPALGIVAAMAFSYLIPYILVGTFTAGVFGVSIAAVGMLSIVGTIVSNDAYGPICDNARGIAEQGDLGEEVIREADRLDMAGNTAKAITKGYAIGAANLTVLALLFSFSQDAGAAITNNINLLNVSVLIGAFIGVVAPALFSAVLILAVQRNAALMVDEIRRQFEEDPGILKGETAADFNKCIDIATKGALKELIIPSIISIAIPLAVGLIFGVASLGAFLAGSILSGFVFAIFMANSGGAWDNAKKWIEDGNLGGKGTDAHKASITGDTVGDPFKDTAGPSINTLLVVMSLTASIFIGLFLVIGNGTGLLGALF